ncbi:MAG: ABC transporter permease [Protaetiibacter sp.]
MTATVPMAAPPAPRRGTKRRLLGALTPLRWAALVFLVLVIVAAIAAPLIAPYDPLAQDIPGKLQPIGSPGHLLGTDEYGRDVLSRLIYGARVELVVALGATIVAMVLGVSLGLLGGFLGRWVEVLTMRGVEVIMAFPPIVLALLIVTIYGSGQVTLIAIMGLLFAPAFARLTYGQTLGVKNAEYVEAARAFSARTPTILFAVVLPNVSGPVIAQFPVTIATAILLESGLSYLGLGITPPTPSWGAMVASGQRFMSISPDLLVVSSLTVAVTVLAFGLVGDAVRDAFDPKNTRRSA